MTRRSSIIINLKASSRINILLVLNLDQGVSIKSALVPFGNFVEPHKSNKTSNVREMAQSLESVLLKIHAHIYRLLDTGRCSAYPNNRARGIPLKLLASKYRFFEKGP